jgi:hypothetical protein
MPMHTDLQALLKSGGFPLFPKIGLTSRKGMGENLAKPEEKCTHTISCRMGVLIVWPKFDYRRESL